MPDEGIVGAITRAIAEKRLIEFMYKEFVRIAEPHVYGVYKGKYQLLTYQIAGDSSRPEDLPNWRRVDLEEMRSLRVLDETFPGARDYRPSRTSKFDTIIAVVQ